MISDDILMRELRAIFSKKGFDMNSETPKTIRARLCKSLGLETFPAEKNATLKQYMVRLVNESDEGDCAEGDDEEEVTKSKKKRKSLEQKRKNSVAKRKATQNKKHRESEGGKGESDDEDLIRPTKKKQKSSKHKGKKPVADEKSVEYNQSVKSLIALGTAMRMGPSLHRGLKEMNSNSERIDALTERLRGAGASWKGKIPSKADISSAKQTRQRMDDLDGIDTSLILDSSSSGRPSRRCNRAPVNYYADMADGTDGEEEEMEEKEPTEEQSGPDNKVKKTQRKLSSSSSENDEDDDFDSESSEEEFD